MRGPRPSIYEKLLALTTNDREAVASYYLEMVWAYILGMGGRLGECVRALPAAA